jgi:hypothetical protein
MVLKKKYERGNEKPYIGEQTIPGIKEKVPKR